MTTSNPALNFLKLLSHDLRWQLVAILAESDRRVQELVEFLKRPQNLISYHLRLLRDGKIVRERRSSADGRDVYYSLDLDRLRALYLDSGQALHPSLAKANTTTKTELVTSERPYRVLFLCTHNSARSQLAEGILRAQGGESVEVFSAGSQPAGIHPMTVKAAAALNIDISGQRSQHIDEFSKQPFDTVITVCDKIREVCPVFPADTRQIHWSFPDPAEVTGGEAEQYTAFLTTVRELSTRIRYFLMMIQK